jgi:hypothetical protein
MKIFHRLKLRKKGLNGEGAFISNPRHFASFQTWLKRRCAPTKECWSGLSNNILINLEERSNLMPEETEMSKLPRFSFQIPADLTAVFVNEMKRELRETPGDLLTAIVRRYFSGLAHTEVVDRLKAEALQDGQRIPNYGVKSLKTDTGLDVQQKGSRE